MKSLRELDYQVTATLREKLKTASKGRARIRVPDHDKLYASINQNKKVTYCLRYRFEGNDTTLTYQGGLENVHPLYLHDLKLLENGVNPYQDKKQKIVLEREKKERERREDESSISLSNAFQEWISDPILFIPDRDRKEKRFNKHIKPKLGNTPINKLTRLELVRFFSPYYLNQPSTAEKLFSILSQCYSYFQVHFPELPSIFDKALTNQLRASRSKGAEKKEHLPAIDFRGIPRLIDILTSMDERKAEPIYLKTSKARFCLFQILTACRDKAARNLKWSDIVWRNRHKRLEGHFVISNEDNKNKGLEPEFRTIYFGELVGGFLQAWENYDSEGSPYVFPSATNPFKPISDSDASDFWRDFVFEELKQGRYWCDPRTKKRSVPQGIARNCFRTWGAYQRKKDGSEKYSWNLLEFCILHEIRGTHKGAYISEKGLEVEEIFKLKNDWEGYCFLMINEVNPHEEEKEVFKDWTKEQCEAALDEEERRRQYLEWRDNIFYIPEDNYLKFGGKEELEKMTIQREKEKIRNRELAKKSNSAKKSISN